MSRTVNNDHADDSPAVRAARARTHAEADRIGSMVAGCRVAFSRAFLRSTGQHTGPAPFARGTIQGLPESLPGGPTLVRVRWDDGTLSKVNRANLWPADRLHLEPQ